MTDLEIGGYAFSCSRPIEVWLEYNEIYISREYNQNIKPVLML